MIYNWLNFVQNALLPVDCTLCGQRLSGSKIHLCGHCVKHLPWLNHACSLCALPLPHNQTICGKCQRQPPPFNGARCLFKYDFPVARLISDLKFHQQLSYGVLLGQLLAMRMEIEYTSDTRCKYIVPIPLHRTRLRTRGFNQSQEIAKSCAGALKIDLRNQILKRTTPTQAQTELTAEERKRNLRNAFSAKPAAPGLIVLIDDVMTTGATAEHAALALRRAGNIDIDVWCIARTHD